MDAAMLGNEMSEDDEQSSFGIKKIVDCKIGEGGRQMYRVKWEPTWEPAENLASCQHLIDEFWSFVNKAKTNEEAAQQQRKRMRLEQANRMNVDQNFDRLSEDSKADVQRLIARSNVTSVGTPLMSPSNMLMASPLNNPQNTLMGMARTPTHGNNQNFPHSPQTPQNLRQQSPMQMQGSGQKSLNFNSPQQGKMAAKTEADDTVESKSKSTPFVLDGYQNEYAEVAFLCKICKKSLPADRKNSWKAHYKTHSERKEFVCSVCQKGFHTRFNMERHMKTHNKNGPPMKSEPCSEFPLNTGMMAATSGGLIKDELMFN